MRLRGLSRGMLAAMTLWAWLAPDTASAQPARDGRVEVSGGLLWAGTTGIASGSADEISFGGQPRTVFRSRTELEASPGLVTRVGVRLTSVLQVEGSVALNATHLTVRLTADDEAPGGRATTKTASESVTQYLFEGGLVARPPRWRTRHVTSFVSTGAGHVRQVHQGQTLVETGRSFYVGAGAFIGPATRPGARRRVAGLRVDARAMILQDGVSTDHDPHLSPVVGASLCVRF